MRESVRECGERVRVCVWERESVFERVRACVRASVGARGRENVGVCESVFERE